MVDWEVSGEEEEEEEVEQLWCISAVKISRTRRRAWHGSLLVGFERLCLAKGSGTEMR